MYDESKPTPFSEPNTENATKFHYNDLFEEQHQEFLDHGPQVLRNQWKRFHGYNTGLYNGYWGNNKKLRRQDNDRLFDTLAGYLDLSRHQRERGKLHFKKIDYQKYGSYYTVLDIAFYTCVFVANIDYRGGGWIYYPTKKTYNHPPPGKAHVRDAHEPFVDIVDRLNLDNPAGKVEKGLRKFEPVVGL